MAEAMENGSGSVSVLLCPSLHPAGIAQKLEELFDTLGYGPLQKFFDAGGRVAAAEYADRVAGELAGVIAGLPAGDTGVDTVSVFGHAVFLNAVAFTCAYWIRLSESDQERLTQIDLGEAEGLLLQREPKGFGTLTHLHLRD
jgi:hypothetical protein